jgi:hypothetical protein
MAEDLGIKDVLGHVFGFEEVAAESGVGAAQVPGFTLSDQGVGLRGGPGVPILFSSRCFCSVE